MEIVAALFVESIDFRQVAGPATRIWWSRLASGVAITTVASRASSLVTALSMPAAAIIDRAGST